MNTKTDPIRRYVLAKVVSNGFTLASYLVLVGALAPGLASAAESRPKLALTEVEPSAVLAQKYVRHSPDPSAAAPASTAPRASVRWLGEWRGQARRKKLFVNVVLEVTQSSDGAITAKLTNKAGHNTWDSTLAALTDAHLKLGFHRPNKPGGVDGGDLVCDVNPVLEKVLMTWSRWDPPLPIKMRHVVQVSSSAFQTAAAPVSAAAVPESLSLEQMIEATETQLADQLEACGLFEIMGAAELSQAIPPAHGEGRLPYNLKDPATLQQFKKAGVRYLLVPTVEEFTEQVMDQSQWSAARQTTDFEVQGSSRSASAAVGARGRGGAKGYRETARSGTVSGSVAKQQEFFDPKVQKVQVLYLTMRSQLFDTTTGALLDSDKFHFNTNRSYTALAQGRNDLLTDDLIQAAAKRACEWAEVRVGMAVFPITVLDRTEKEITINRGLGGALRLGQVYGVYKLGKELRDPTSGEVLGRDEETVGRVTLRELHEKFSKAGILEDKGIAPGAILRRMTY